MTMKMYVICREFGYGLSLHAQSYTACDNATQRILDLRALKVIGLHIACLKVFSEIKPVLNIITVFLLQLFSLLY